MSDPPVTSHWVHVSLLSPLRAHRPGTFWPVTGPATAALWAGLGAVGAVGALSACGPAPSGQAGQAGQAKPSASARPALVPGALLHGPLGCPAGTAVLVLQRLAVQLQHTYTAVVARCDSGAGSPPSGVYLVSGDAGAARVAETLVGPGEQLQVSALVAAGTGVAVAAAGYSRADVPRCCPDLTVTLTWRAVGDRLVPVP